MESHKHSGTDAPKVDGRDLDGKQLYYNGSIVSLRANDADGATVIVDWSIANSHAVTIGGNRTIQFVNPKDSQVLILAVKQGGGGSNTVTWPSTVSWEGGTAPTLTTTAGKIDVFTFWRHDGESKEFAQIVGLNY